MSTELVNLEEQGRRIARISGAISMINESSYIVRSKSRYDTYNIIATKSERVVHVQIMLVTMPSASTYLQLNFIAIEVR